MAINIPGLFVTGLPCSGKTEFLSIASSMPLLCIEWSHVLTEALDVYRESTNRGQALELIEEIVREKGDSYFPDQILLMIRTHLEDSAGEYKGVVISGARNPAELRILSSSFARSLVVVLCSEYQTRYWRSQRRARRKDPQSIEDFVRNDFAELNTGIAKIADEMTPVLIFNDGKLSEFAHQATDLLTSYFLQSDRNNSQRRI